MTKDDILLLYEYDRWANGRVFLAVATVSTEQFTRDLGGSFHSLRDTLAHLISGEWIWLTYWKAPSHDGVFFSDLKARREAIFDPLQYPDVAALQVKWAEIETAMNNFVVELTDELLERMVPARGTQIKLVHLMQHVANHSTYHRGQVALMMRQIGAEPATTDFHVFLAEGMRP
jgi:uncharacterized damage-inducible protein DinB